MIKLGIEHQVRSLKGRLMRLKESITEAIGETDINVRKLDDELIIHDLYLVKCQLDRVEDYIE